MTFDPGYSAVVAHDRAEHELRECKRIIKRAQEVLRNPRYSDLAREHALDRIARVEAERAAWAAMLRG